MKNRLVAMLISALLKTLTPDLLKELVDMLLDWVETRVTGSRSQVDDAMVLPICHMIRTTFDIPDDNGDPAHG